ACPAGPGGPAGPTVAAGAGFMVHPEINSASNRTAMTNGAFILSLLRGVARRKMAAPPQTVVRSIVTSEDNTHSAAVGAVSIRTAPQHHRGSEGRAMCSFLYRILFLGD